MNTASSPQMPPVAAEILGKLKAMEHHTSPPSSLIWRWLLVSFGEPLVTFLTAFSEGWSDYRKEFTIFGAVIILHPRNLATSVSGVEGLVLFLSGLGCADTVFGHAGHILGDCDHRRSWRWSG